MPKVTPPLAVYNPELARAIGKAYRQAYKAESGKPHAAGMAAARTAFVQQFPFPNEDMAAEVIRSILRGIEQKFPGWLSNNGPKRFPASNEDAAAEVADIGRRWF